MAWFRKRPAVGLMHHPDRGSPYARQAVQTKLKDYGRLCSLRRKGTFWDNAPTESWFNRLKTERVHALRDATQNDMIRLLATDHQLSSWMRGSANRITKNGHHEVRPLADEKPRKPHAAETQVCAVHKE